MSATIQVNGIEATINEYVWTSQKSIVAEYLNSLLDPLGPSGSDPNPDHTAALLAAQRLGGKVTHYDKLDYVAGRVY